MERIKKLFCTPKKAILTIVCAAAILGCLGVGTTLAAETAIKRTSIGEEQAENFAFADAGVDPAAAEYVKTEFDHEQGQFVYEVEFTADNTEYEYWIKASDGTVVKKQSEILFGNAEGEGQTATADTYGEKSTEQATADQVADETAANETADTDAAGNQTTDGTADTNVNENKKAGNYIGVDKAKEIAVKHAGLSASDVTFSKAKLENDDGITEYEVEFYRGRMEYDYSINAKNGEILEYDSEYEDD